MHGYTEETLPVKLILLIVGGLYTSSKMVLFALRIPSDPEQVYEPASETWTSSKTRSRLRVRISCSILPCLARTFLPFLSTLSLTSLLVVSQ